MLKFFAGKQIFAFLAIFFITFVVGFFVWNLFIGPQDSVFNRVLGEMNQIGAKFFPASLPVQAGLLQDSGIENMVPATDLAQEVSSEPPVETVVVESQNPVVAPAESFQDQLDNIQEKLDIISQQVQELIAEQNLKDSLVEADKDKIADDQKDADKKEDDQNIKKEEDLQEYEKPAETTVCTGQININTALAVDLEKITQVGPVTAQKIIATRPFYLLNDLLKVSGIGEITLQKIIEQGCAYVESALSGGASGGGGSAPIVYPKILISEVQPAGVTDDKQEFVELYNPNNQDIDLTGWYLQKKTATGSSWQTYASSNLFSGKTISASSYFLIARNGYYADLADVSTDSAITDNNSFAFKNPKGDISDKLGFGNALDFELLATTSPSLGQSIGRKWDSITNTEQDTDNNSADFEIDKPTPKEKNIKWVEPTLVSIAITVPATKLTYIVDDELDISGLVVTGTYSDSSTQVETITIANIAGFNSSSSAAGQILTITIGGQSVVYTIDINPAPTLQSITITTLATKLIYNVGESLDISGLVVTGTYSDGSTELETIMSTDVTGFDSSTAITGQVLTITFEGQTVIYTITIKPVVVLPIITSYTFNGVAQNITVNPTTNPVLINFVANGNIDWVSIKIENTSDATIYKTLLSDKTGCVDWTSSCSKTWSGEISPSGKVLIDGDYQIKVHIKDASTNEFNDYVTPYIITVDRT